MRVRCSERDAAARSDNAVARATTSDSRDAPTGATTHHCRLLPEACNICHGSYSQEKERRSSFSWRYHSLLSILLP